MVKIPSYRWQVLGRCLGLVLVVPALASGLFAADKEPSAKDVVRLPTFEVVDSRNAKSQPWLYAEIPGFEILSLAGERRTRAAIAALLRGGQYVPLLLPVENPVPSGPPAALFLNHPDDSTLVDALKRQYHWPFWLEPAVLSLPANAGTNTVLMPDLQFLSGWPRYNSVVSFLLTDRTLQLYRPAYPTWFLNGIFELFDTYPSADRGFPNDWVSESFLEFRPASNPAPFVGSLSKILTRAAATAHPDRMPLAEFFAMTTSDQTNALAMAAGRGSYHSGDYRKTAELFTHWALFSSQGNRRAAFLKFAEAARWQAADENLFQKHFGLSYAQTDAELTKYAKGPEGKTKPRIDRPAAAEVRTAADVKITSASRKDVVRLTATAYLSLAQRFENNRLPYLKLASETLENAGVDDPRLDALLGVVAVMTQDWTRADELLSSSPIRSVETLLARAQLALHRAGASPDDGKALPEAAAAEVLNLVHEALRTLPHSAEAYGILADIHQRSTQPVPDADLLLLRQATREYPLTQTLAADTARLYLRSGQAQAAREIVEAALRWPVDEDNDKGRLALLQLKVELAK